MTTKVPSSMLNGGITPSQLDSTALAMIRDGNKIINGNFAINQRSAGPATLAEGILVEDSDSVISGAFP